MDIRFSLAARCARYVALIFAIAGCRKAADQPATVPTNSDGSASSSAAGTPAAPNNQMTMQQQQPPPTAPTPLVVPAETIVSVALIQAVGSKISTPGQAFSATVAAPIEVDGRLAIPKGARASGIVRDAKPAGRFKGAGTLELTLTAVTVRNEDYNIRTTSPSQTSTGKGKRTAAMVSGGTGGGALIGGVAGGGKGALIGGLIGAAAATGGAGLTGNRDILLPAETRLTFKLVEPVEIKLGRAP
jgi:hypothetical protein